MFFTDLWQVAFFFDVQIFKLIFKFLQNILHQSISWQSSDSSSSQMYYLKVRFINDLDFYGFYDVFLYMI